MNEPMNTPPINRPPSAVTEENILSSSGPGDAAGGASAELAHAYNEALEQKHAALKLTVIDLQTRLRETLSIAQELRELCDGGLERERRLRAAIAKVRGVPRHMPSFLRGEYDGLQFAPNGCLVLWEDLEAALESV